MPTNSPGRGSSWLEPPRGRYVYLVRSRRTHGISVGIDLTSAGSCPLRCDYCQVDRTCAPPSPRAIDLRILRDELVDALKRLGPDASDVAFAGAGEPTWSPSFCDALAVAVDQARAHAPPLPVRVFTSGVLLHHDRMRAALVALRARHHGEVWVKLDSWDDRSLARIAGIRGQNVHELRIAHLARYVPVVLQTMVARRADGPSIEDVARGLSCAVARLVARGAQIDRVTLTTLFRPPGAPTKDLSPATAADLALVARALTASGVEVDVAATDET